MTVKTCSLVLCAAIAIVGFSATGFADTAAAPVRIAFIAYQNPDKLAGEIEPVVEYLEARLGRKVKSFVATDYAGIVEALRNEDADVGFMGPLQYIIAHDRVGARVLLGEVYGTAAQYRSHIFVRKDSGITALAGLKGKSMAFTDPISSSGYLYPLETFRDEGLIKDRPEDFFGRVYFAGGDEQAIRAVLNGFVDAAGIGQFSYTLLRPEERDQVTIIGESPPIPSHCVVARAGFDQAAANDLRAALLALNDEGEHHYLLKNLYNVDGYVEVTHADYAGTEALARKNEFID